jgi:glycosyltransferase involved in cell wall biosynthesis
VAKGILTHPDQLHLCYIHTPIRYAWDLQQQYLKGASLQRGVKAMLAQAILHYLRLWDVASANRVDRFVANSQFVARRVWKTYRRPATVIYPPVAVDRFRADRPREDFYFVLSRFVPYKRVDLIVEAFARLGLPLVVIGDGSGRKQLEAIAQRSEFQDPEFRSSGKNIQFLGHQPDEVVVDYMERCKAFVFAAAEDFGIAPVEAQAAGAPVIAFGKGGVTETVIAEKTGLFFPEQTVESLIAAIQRFEQMVAGDRYRFDPEILRRNAEQYAPERFREQFQQFVHQSYQRFRR